LRASRNSIWNGEPHRPHKILYSAFSRQPPFSFIVEITKQLDRKLAACEPTPPNSEPKEGAASIYQPGVDIFELITIDARRMGQLIRKPYAEAYVIREAIEIDDPMTMSVASI